MATLLERGDEVVRTGERRDLVDDALELLLPLVAHVVSDLTFDRVAGDGGDIKVPAHADVPVQVPRCKHDVLLTKRAVPAQHLVVARVDERAVDVEKRGARYELAVEVFAACSSCRPSANSSIAFLLNAGMSSGLRLVTRPLSTCTSSSTQGPPPLRMSVCSAGNDVHVPAPTAPP